MSSEQLLLQRIVSGGVGWAGLVGPLGASLHTHRYPKDFQPTQSEVFLRHVSYSRACNSRIARKRIHLGEKYSLFGCSRLKIIEKVDVMLFHLIPSLNG